MTGGALDRIDEKRPHKKRSGIWAQDGDSTAQKSFGALINAAIFIGFVTIMTFVLVFLFKRGVRHCAAPAPVLAWDFVGASICGRSLPTRPLCRPQYTNFIYGYMCFAGFSIFFVMAGVISLQLLETAQIAMVSATSWF